MIKDDFKREILFSLLDERNRNPKERTRIDQEIKDDFERELAVMIVDSVRFSWKTMEYGIIQFLSVLRKVNADLKSIIRKYRGKVISEWADNFVIVFASPNDAIEAGIEMNAYLTAYNEEVEKSDHFGISIGIGFGSVLYVGDDVFGQEVNLASKLGEDVAGEGDILLTESAYHGLKGNSVSPVEREKEVELSGVSFVYYRVRY